MQKVQAVSTRGGSFGCGMTVQTFMKIVWTVFEKILKSPKTAVFGHFWANFGYVSHISVMLI